MLWIHLAAKMSWSEEAAHEDLGPVAASAARLGRGRFLCRLGIGHARAHGAELLSSRWVDADGLVEVSLGDPRLDCNASELDNFTGRVAHLRRPTKVGRTGRSLMEGGRERGDAHDAEQGALSQISTPWCREQAKQAHAKQAH